MKIKAIKLLPVKCKRCGAPVYSLNKSILNNPTGKAEVGILCSNCATPEEQHQILNQQGLALVKSLQPKEPK